MDGAKTTSTSVDFFSVVLLALFAFVFVSFVEFLIKSVRERYFNRDKNRRRKLYSNIRHEYWNNVIDFLDPILDDCQSIERSEWKDSAMLKSHWPTRISSACKILKPKLGRYSELIDPFLSGGQTVGSVRGLSGALSTIKHAINNGMLTEVEDLVMAEIFTDMLDQGDYLLSQNYYLAAGVIYRSVLEERLRKLCDSKGVKIAVRKPTIEAYKNALYTAKILDIVGMKSVETMAAVGNQAAHNLPELRKDSVDEFRVNLRSFLVKFSS